MVQRELGSDLLADLRGNERELKCADVVDKGRVT